MKKRVKLQKSGFNFEQFNNAGYLGLYGLPLSDVEKSKKAESGQLLKKLSGVELAANLFRITQTEERLKRDKINNQKDADEAHFFVGNVIRETLENVFRK